MTRRMRLDRARWRCRRGMKELDVLLERFAGQALDRLDDHELDALERLLGQPDQDVHAWLVSEPGSQAPPDMEGIVALVRACAVGAKSRPPHRTPGVDNPE